MLVESINGLALSVRWIGKANWTAGLIRISQIQHHACGVGCAGSKIAGGRVNRSSDGSRVWLRFVDMGKPCTCAISGTCDWKVLDHSLNGVFIIIFNALTVHISSNCCSFF